MLPAYEPYEPSGEYHRLVDFWMLDRRPSAPGAELTVAAAALKALVTLAAVDDASRVGPPRRTRSC